MGKPLQCGFSFLVHTYLRYYKESIMGVKQSILAQMLHDLKLDPTHAHTVADMDKNGIMKSLVEEVEPEPVVEEKQKTKAEIKAADVEAKADAEAKATADAAELVKNAEAKAAWEGPTASKDDEKPAASPDKDKVKKS
jgi:hypothetical protein